MTERYTPWFLSTERPVRDGVYQVSLYPDTDNNPIYAHWSGRRGCWGPAFFSAYKAAGLAGVYGRQDRHWRGLTLEAAYPWPIVHTSGCGRTAFRYAVEPKAGEIACSHLAVTHDGNSVLPYNNPVCPHCGVPLLASDLSTAAIAKAYAAEQQ